RRSGLIPRFALLEREDHCVLQPSGVVPQLLTFLGLLSVFLSVEQSGQEQEAWQQRSSHERWAKPDREHGSPPRLQTSCPATPGTPNAPPACTGTANSTCP